MLPTDFGGNMRVIDGDTGALTAFRDPPQLHQHRAFRGFFHPPAHPSTPSIGRIP